MLVRRRLHRDAPFPPPSPLRKRSFSMLKRFIVPALVTAVAFFVSPGNSQVQSTGDPAQDQMIQDMRDAAAQAQQNMQQQGIDPQQFGQQLMQQMQNGTLDP